MQNTLTKKDTLDPFKTNEEKLNRELEQSRKNFENELMLLNGERN